MCSVHRPVLDGSLEALTFQHSREQLCAKEQKRNERKIIISELSSEVCQDIDDWKVALVMMVVLDG